MDNDLKFALFLTTFAVGFIIPPALLFDVLNYFWGETAGGVGALVGLPVGLYVGTKLVKATF